MAGRKNRTYDKDLDQVQRLKHENEKLKRENSRLKKQLDRVDFTKLEHLSELVDQQALEEHQLNTKSKRQKLMDRWQCHECREGHLRIHIVNRLDGVFYFRKCSLCRNKTRLKKYSEDVEGIKDEK